MKHAALIDALADYRIRYPAEADAVERFVALLGNVTACFQRDCWQPGHITGSAWIVDRLGERVLLTHHRKLGRWLQLGGHADGQTDALAVAQREGEEESGLRLQPISTALFDIDIHEIPARKSDPAHLHFDLRYAFQVIDDETFTVSDESHDLEWVNGGDLSPYTTEESMLRMAAKWRALHGSTLAAGSGRRWS